jgi:hypothetical protein
MCALALRFWKAAAQLAFPLVLRWCLALALLSHRRLERPTAQAL